MNENVRGGLIAGLIAAVIWMIITVAVGGFGKVPIIAGGLLFLVGTWAVSAAISTIISRSRRTQAS